MTASMIEWTLEVLDWIRPQLWERWPEAEMRGSSPELSPDGYRIRFRDRGRQFWLVFSPELIQYSTVAEVQSLMNAGDWLQVLRESGSLRVERGKDPPHRPVLIPVRTMEMKARAS
jgi:hypothetical protein